MIKKCIRMIYILGILMMVSACSSDDGKNELNAPTMEQENEALKEQVVALQAQVDALEKQLALLQDEGTGIGDDADEVINTETGSKLAGDKSVISEDGTTITVHNARELVYHMANNRTFLLEEGDYNMTDISYDLNPDYFSYGFMNLQNVTIIGNGDQQVDFMTPDIYNDVIRFTNCSGITLRNLNLGHNPAVEFSYCSGGVIILGNSQNVTIEDCTMFGSGTVGIIADNVIDLKVLDSRIYDCSRNIVELMNMETVLFDNCVFENQSNENLLMDNVLDVRLNQVTLLGHVADYPNILLDGNLKLDMASQGDEVKIENRSYGEVALKNVTISGYEVVSLVKEIDSGFEVELYSGMNEISGENYTDYTLIYDVDPGGEVYLDHLERASSIIKDYYGNPNYITYGSIMLKGQDMPIISSYWDGRLNITGYKGSINTLLGNQTDYITPDEGKKYLIEGLPKLQYLDRQETSQLWSDETLQWGSTFVYEGQVYYSYYTLGDDFYFWRDLNVNASTGEISVWFDGQFNAPIELASDKLVDAVRSYMLNYETDASIDPRFIPLIVGNHVLLIVNDFFGQETLSYTTSGDAYVFDIYYEYYGD